jgi:hypothetical protein
VISSGCHSFWRNDRRKPIPQLLSGVILLGAMRAGPRGLCMIDGPIGLAKFRSNPHGE